MIEVSGQCGESTGKALLASALGNGEKVTSEAVSELDIDRQGERFEKKLGGDVSGESWSCAKAGKDMGTAMLPLLRLATGQMRD